MADDKDKEQDTNPAKTEAENLLEIVIPALDTEEGVQDQEKENAKKLPDAFILVSETVTDTSNQETENMEVHHHGHHHEHHEGKRSRKSYFWEFLMLFLAVFCGSLAEYGLEHKIENDREKAFIETMISDLKEDTTLLGESIIQFKQKGIEIDSLTILLNSSNIKDQWFSALLLWKTSKPV